MTGKGIQAAVAAGHPATAAAGAEILAEGGTAADATVAAALASCVAETVMTGLVGGGPGSYGAAGRWRSDLCAGRPPADGRRTPGAARTACHVRRARARRRRFGLRRDDCRRAPRPLRRARRHHHRARPPRVRGTMGGARARALRA